MRIGRKAAARFEFPPEIFQFLLRDATLEIGASIYSRGSVSLVINYVAVAILSLGAQEVIEGHFIERSCRSESRDVTADSVLKLVGSDHHGQRIPAFPALPMRSFASLPI